MTDLEMLRSVKGCGAPVKMGRDEWNHDYAIIEADECENCARLLVSAIRNGALEEAAKACEDRAEKMREWAEKHFANKPERLAERRSAAEWVTGCAEIIRTMKAQP